ncbi:hypothetical protein [Halorubrum vacuolatum]|uniref:Uncharacterized protein n=1 Tax=Halorubrum vacuolatum TaxID=63740 RepID=A0A238YA72_HALVU|nr:hypothetical protein [Halorubrum vacuolatum]SNR67661.1 hypothetical protein SAMN06264855_13410 [Halorubrum vacuolatum]
MSGFEIYDTEPQRTYPTEGREDQSFVDAVRAVYEADRAVCLFSPSDNVVIHRLDAIHRRPGRGAREQIYYAVAHGYIDSQLLERLAGEVEQLFSSSQEWESVEEGDKRRVTAEEVAALSTYSSGFEDGTSLEREVGQFLQSGGSEINVAVPSRNDAHETLCRYSDCDARILITRNADAAADHFTTDLIIEYGSAESFKLASEKSKQTLKRWRQNQQEQELNEAVNSLTQSFHTFFNDDEVDDYTRAAVLNDIIKGEGAVPNAKRYDTEETRTLLESIEYHLRDVQPENKRKLESRVERTAKEHVEEFRRSVRNESADTVRSTVADETKRIADLFDEPNGEIRRQVLDQAIPEFDRPSKVVKDHRVPWPVWNTPDLMVGVFLGGLLMTVIFVSIAYFDVSISIPWQI